MCLLTWDGRLEGWDTRADVRVVDEAVESASDVVPALGGCVSLASSGTAVLHRAGAPALPLVDDALAVAADGARLAVATAASADLLEASGAVTEHHEIGPGATAIGRVAGELVVGYGDGLLEVLDAEHRTAFEGTPRAAVTAIAEGPRSVVVAGFAGGDVGLWPLEGGDALERARLHGPALHLAVQGSVLTAASDLGDHLRLDLGVLDAPYCDVLRAVWARVPTLWTGGRPAAAAPAAGHPCAAP